MGEKLKKILMGCWAVWIILFCLATFLDIGFLQAAKNGFLTVVGAVHFFYLFKTREGGLKWVFLVCSMIFVAMFVFAIYLAVMYI